LSANSDGNNPIVPGITLFISQADVLSGPFKDMRPASGKRNKTFSFAGSSIVVEFPDSAEREQTMATAWETAKTGAKWLGKAGLVAGAVGGAVIGGIAFGLPGIIAGAIAGGLKLALWGVVAGGAIGGVYGAVAERHPAPTTMKLQLSPGQAPQNIENSEPDLMRENDPPIRKFQQAVERSRDQLKSKNIG
jgi:hypothetical protein